MRFQLGFSILLVLIVSLLCTSSFSFGEENQEIGSAPTQTLSSPQNSSATIAESDDYSQQVKRDSVGGRLGMPAHRSSDNVPSQVELVDSEANISPPVNPPEGSKEGLGEVSGIKSQEQDQNQGTANVLKSEARSLGSELLSSLNPERKDYQPQQATDSAQVNHDDLPKIIENNRQVNPTQPTNYLEQQSSQQTASVGSGAIVQQGQNTKPSPPMSSARTFDSWTSCVGSSTNKYGTCKNDVECEKNKGRADGSCMGGFGVCCVMALTCNDKSSENNTFFANPDFPEPSWEARLCEVEVKKKSSNVLQVMIEFEEFELAPPNHQGECMTDIFTVRLASNKLSPYSMLRICGQNTGQHIYLDVSQLDEPIVLSLATSGGGFPRRWSIRIVQMDEKNHLLAPPGCLQYYTDTVGHFRSFNLGMNLKYLYYAICFRIDNGYSGIRFTENFFGMNGPSCRKRSGGGSIGHNNATFGAHPHHLVIPPPGLGHHLNKYHQPQLGYIERPGRFQHQGFHHAGRHKRLAYSEANERFTRTHHEHEFKSEDHSVPHGQASYGQPFPGYSSAPSNYGPPSPGYGSYPSAYGAGSGYGHQPVQSNYGYEHYKGDSKGEWKGDEKFHDKHHEPSKGSWGVGKWGEAFGWQAGVGAGVEKNKHHEHHEGYSLPYGKSSYDGYGSHGYGPPSYGQLGYGPQSYGPQSYGPPAYGPGKYHHKEIDKFGEKYEHLEYKHEKNHHEKEASKGWWPSWGKKEEKKDKDKFYTHHEALFPMIRMPEMPHCEPRYCGQNDVITFPPSGNSIAEMCGNRFNQGRGPKIISGNPLVVYVSNRGHSRGAGFDMNYEQVFFTPNRY